MAITDTITAAIAECDTATQQIQATKSALQGALAALGNNATIAQSISQQIAALQTAGFAADSAVITGLQSAAATIGGM